MTDPEPRARNRRITAVADVPEPVPAGPAPSPTPEDPPPEELPRRRVNWRRIGWSAGAVMVAGLLAASWFALPIRSVTIEGNRQLSVAQVRQLAGLTPGFAWPYYGAWRAQGLQRSPWIESATVTRRFPDAVHVRVVERVPFARWQRPDGSVVALAEDGTVLPDAQGVAGLPLLTGWGPSRLEDALFVARALGRYNVQSVAYTPSGITAQTASGTVWSGDLKHLLKYAGAIQQFPGKQIHIYPWGVSVQE
ncbi:cell division protein FtsQ [Deinococcus geothermalis DSM 11300]|uniref:Cell division protein FtsQ n=1 Tax=Deinococcus geothermalis (strain DSM 11300 / CIP 105573 / AG-3a) TaxID=319795 RepID=Q1IXV6_DEIGD|nr:FtsQ-type POTRA domain-containing protein [Deinococcus geothermalis]ABF45928.1 cell division protein FtsQ [Deinococcus geothermalis DSM 11300]